MSKLYSEHSHVVYNRAMRSTDNVIYYTNLVLNYIVLVRGCLSHTIILLHTGTFTHALKTPVSFCADVSFGFETAHALFEPNARLRIVLAEKKSYFHQTHYNLKV